MDDTNFYTVQGWMINKLHLKGNKLNCFAIIYGFSQDGKSAFSGSYNYISEFLSCSKRSVIDVINQLEEEGLIYKHKGDSKEMESNVYMSAVTFRNGEVISINPPSEKNALPWCKNDTTPSEKNAPNNNKDNYLINNKEKDIDSVPSSISKEKKTKKRFTGVNPSKEEVEAYIKEKDFHVSADTVISYYTNNGDMKVWRFKDGSLIRDWKRCVCTCERNWKDKGGISRTPERKADKEDYEKLVRDHQAEFDSQYEEMLRRHNAREVAI